MGSVIGQVMHAQNQRQGNADGKANTFSLTYEYNLSKRSVVYVSSGYVNNNAINQQSLVAGSTSVAANGLGASVRAVSLGMTHKF